MPKYKQKSIEVEAIQLREDNIFEVAEFVGELNPKSFIEKDMLKRQEMIAKAW